MDCTYEMGVTRSFVEAMCSNINIEDGGEGDWAQFDFTDLFHFLKYREDQYLFQEENVYGNGPVQPAK